MFKIAIDLGYRYVKAINENGQSILFPSLVGSPYNRQLKGLYGEEDSSNDKFHVRLLNDLGSSEEYFIGDLARESRSVSVAFDTNKIDHQNTRILLASAAALLNPENQNIHLITGLPLQYYSSQKERFKDYLSKFETYVEIPLLERKADIRFSKVTVFPQAAGAVYEAVAKHQELLKKKGSLVALVDIGYKTTDFVVFEAGAGFHLREDLSGTVEIGGAYIHREVQSRFQELTGLALDNIEMDTLIFNKGIYFAGQDYDFENTISAAQRFIAQAVIDRLKTSWGQKLDFIRTMFLAGGSVLELSEMFEGFHPGLKILEDPQMANAKGFLRVGELVQKKERRSVRQNEDIQAEQEEDMTDADNSKVTDISSKQKRIIFG